MFSTIARIGATGDWWQLLRTALTEGWGAKVDEIDAFAPSVSGQPELGGLLGHDRDRRADRDPGALAAQPPRDPAKRDGHSRHPTTDVVDAAARHVQAHVGADSLPGVAQVDAVLERDDLVAAGVVQQHRRLGGDRLPAGSRAAAGANPEAP